MADRYWVDGTGTWSAATTNWSTSSGGASGASAPTATDVAIFDINSNASGGDAAYTCTKTATGSVLGIVIGPTSSNNAVTLAGSAVTTVLSSGLAVAATVNWTLTGAVTFGASTTVCESLTTVIASPIIIGTGFSVTLSNDFKTSSTITCTTTGIINPNDFNCQCSNIDFGGTAGRTIAFGSTGRITFTGTAAAIYPPNSSAAITATGTPDLYFTGNATTGTRSYNPIFGSTTNVFVTAGSGTCQIGLWTGTINNFTFSGYTGGMAANNFLIAGNLTLSSGMTGITGTISLTGVGVTQTITSNGSSLNNLTLSMTGGGTAVLADSCAATAVGSSGVTLNSGTLDLNGFTLSTGNFNSTGATTRAIAFGSGNIALTSTVAATAVLSMATVTGFTFTGTGGFTRNMAATATMVFGTTGGSTTNAPNLTVNAGASALTITTNSHFKNVAFTGSTCTVTAATLNMAGNLTLASGGTYTAVVPTFRASGTVTSAGKTLGNSTINGTGITVTLADAMTTGITNTTTLTAGTLDLAGFTLSTGIFSSSNSTTRAIAFGSGNIALTSTTVSATVLSMTTATDFTFTGTGGFTRNMAALATMGFGTTDGSTTNAPNLTVNAGASALTISNNSFFKNLNFTGSTCAVTGSVNMAGDLTLASGGTYTSLSPTFRDSSTVTSTGKTISGVTVNASGGTITLADAMTLGAASTFTLTTGTFSAANFAVTTTSFSSSNSNTRILNMGSGTWTLTGATAWDTATTTGMTLNPSTSTITMTSASAKTFAGGGLTYYNLNQGGAGALTISGSNTFNNIANTVQPNTITFTAGTTQTVSNFGLSGTAGNLITINSTTPGTQATLSKASGTVNGQFLSIRDSNGTGGASWYATNSTNISNNTGWIFNNPNGMFVFLV